MNGYKFTQVIENRTNVERRLGVIAKSCSCTEIIIEALVLQPMDRQTFVVLLAAPNREGVRTARFTIGMTDEKGGVVSSQHNLSALFLEDVVLSPDNIRFANIHLNKLASFVIRYRRRISQGQLPPTIPVVHGPRWIRCQVANGHRRVALTKEIEEFTWNAAVEIVAGKLSEQEDSGLLRIECAPGCFAEVSVWASARSGVIASPGTLWVGADAVRDGATRRIVLRANDSQPFRITGIRASDSRIIVPPIPDQPRIVHFLDIRVDPSFGAAGKSQLEFETTHPDSPVVSTMVVSSGVGR